MDVNFNNMRLQAVRAVESLAQELQSKINKDGVIEVPADEIKELVDKAMSGVRQMCYVYDEKGDPNFQVVELKEPWWFNEKPEEPS